MTLAVLTGVLAASVIGSVHCLAMCGPLVGLHGGAATTRLAMTHSLGRLTTYVLFGAIAGAVGSAVDLAGRLGNIQRAATVIAAIAIVGLGVFQIVHVTRARARAGAGTRTPFASALVRIQSKSEVRRAWLIGTLTGLLPCGWLWAFVITAAGTGSILGGALVMATFWLGTVPAMVGLLRVTGPLLARIRARVPAITAVALIILGLGTLALRWRDAGITQVNKPHCHCHENGAAS